MKSPMKIKLPSPMHHRSPTPLRICAPHMSNPHLVSMPYLLLFLPCKKALKSPYSHEKHGCEIGYKWRPNIARVQGFNDSIF